MTHPGKTVLLMLFEDRADGMTRVEVFGSGDEPSVGTLTMKSGDWEHLRMLLSYGNMQSVRAHMQMDRVDGT